MLVDSNIKYLLCWNIDGRLVVKRRDCFGPLSRQLCMSLLNWRRWTKSFPVCGGRERGDGFCDGGQHKSAHPWACYCTTAQHLQRCSSHSTTHVEDYSSQTGESISKFSNSMSAPTGHQSTLFHRAQRHVSENKIKGVHTPLYRDWPVLNGVIYKTVGSANHRKERRRKRSGHSRIYRT